MSKNLNNDIVDGLNKLKTDSKDRRDNNVGQQIIATHVLPNYHDKQQILVKISEIYSAPSSWNFYDKLDDNKKLELMESIRDNGILSPVLLWEVDFDRVEQDYENSNDVYDMQGNKYMLLSGHNRCDAYVKLYHLTNEKKYLTIPSIIFKNEELDISTAKELIIDANYVQRTLNTKEKVESIIRKYNELEKNKPKKGRVRDLVAEQFNMSPTTIMNYVKLSEIIEPFRDMVYEKKINLTSALKISDKSQELQQWIYDNYSNIITSEILNKIKPYMKRYDIEKLFEKELRQKIKTKKVSCDVPEDLIDEFKEMVYQWIYNKTKRD